MALFLLRFLPILLPFLFYMVWKYFTGREAKRLGKEPPKFRDAPLISLLIYSLLAGIICFVVIGLVVSNKG